jgi:NAD(P)H-dependent flavin oxidoreductase YrpB (nitropropane dioxygenase family)
VDRLSIRLEDVVLIQGGMGVGTSDPELANKVSGSPHNCLGTVSGALSEWVLARKLQKGDPGGRFRRALAHFPYPDIAQDVLDAYFVPGGIAEGTPYKGVPVFGFNPSPALIKLTICANFAQVWLAKEGHNGLVSINCLEKVQLPLIYNLTGAILAGVDCVTVGAGIPIQIPTVLDLIAQGREVSYKVSVQGNPAGKSITFDPSSLFGRKMSESRRPSFLPIISSHSLASILMNKSSEDGIQGFVVEVNTAGGHNAPPRGQQKLDDLGEPIYGLRDQADWSKMREIGKPFWIGGSVASPAGFKFAKSVGANGIQAGSIFALCEESAFIPLFKAELRRMAFRSELRVKTDVLASPTGFPFKVASLKGTLSEDEVYRARKRVCNKRSLAQAFERADGQVLFRCPADSVVNYVRLGGKAEDCEGRKCLCNGLLDGIGLGDLGESPIYTLGDDLNFARPPLMANEDSNYNATEAICYILGNVPLDRVN